MSQQDVATIIQAAEDALRSEDYKKAWDSLEPILNDLERNGAGKENYQRETLAWLGKVLRIIGDDYDSNAYEAAGRVLKKAAECYPDEPAVLIEQGWVYYGKEYFDKALATFRKVINKVSIANESKIPALQGAGASLQRLHRFIDAEEAFAEAVKLAGGTTTGILIERGWLNFYQQNYECASADFREVLDRADAEKKDRERAMTGQIAIRQIEDAKNTNHSSSSAELLETWFKNNPSLSKPFVADILYAAAQEHRYLNNYPPALIAINLALSLDPDNEDYLATKISTLKWLRRFEEAEALYLEKQQKRRQTSITLGFEMGQTYYEQNRYADALRYFDVEELQRVISADKTGEDFTDDLKYAHEWTIVMRRKMYQFPEAEKKVDEALARFGDTANLLNEKAVLYFNKQEYETAIKIFDRVLKIDEYDEFAHRWRVVSFRKLGKYKKAKQCIREAREKFPLTSWLWEEQAWLYFDQNDLKKADDYFVQAIKLDPYLLGIQFSRVEVLGRLNQNDDALQILLQLKKQFPNDPKVADQLGWFYLRLGKLEHAREQFEFIKTKAPWSALGHNGMGGYFLEGGEFIAAAIAFRRAIKKIGYEPQYHVNRAWAFVRQVKEPNEAQKSECRKKLLDDAEANCRKALKLDPCNAAAYSCLGIIEFKRNCLLDAESYLRRSIDLNPKGDSHVELGALYVQTGRYEEAREQFSKAIAINKNEVRAHVELANLLLVTGNTQEAIRECRQAVATNRHSDEAPRALAIALMRAGQYEEAESVLRKALNNLKESEQWRLHLLLSHILIRLGDDNNKDRDRYNEALKHVNHAKRLNPQSHSDIFFHAGIVDYKLEDYSSAHRNFNECLQINRDRFEAERYGQLVTTAIREQRKVRINDWVGWGLATICFLMLVGLTTLYYLGKTRPIPESEPVTLNNENRQRPAGYQSEKVNAAVPPASPAKPKEELVIDKSLFTFMTPLLLGLLVVALLLPNLKNLKLPGGFEAEISEVKTKETISSGPKGNIGFGTSVPIISPGPGSR